MSLNGYPLGQDKSEFIIVSHKNEYRCVYVGMYLIKEEDFRTYAKLWTWHMISITSEAQYPSDYKMRWSSFLYNKAR